MTHPLHTAWLTDQAAPTADRATPAVPASHHTQGTQPPARTALDYARATVRSVAPARLLTTLPTRGGRHAYVSSDKQNIVQTLSNLRKQLRNQEQAA